MAFKCTRWSLANILPVAFVLWIVTTIWALYVMLHLAHLLFHQDPALRRQGLWEAAISQSLTMLLLTCFSRAVFTDPGSVPETAEWNSRGETGLRSRFSFRGQPEGPSEGQANEQSADLPKSHEVKQTGERRFCKWCDQYKPDRCHHCRVCRSCILRMDHHCPWIANCVGFRNHKYFFLLVLYSWLTCLYVVRTMSATVLRAANDEMVSWQRFLIVFGMTLAVMMGLMLWLFLCIHITLVLRAQTTIEYCEKRHRRCGKHVNYDVGIVANVNAALGSNPLLWLLPVNPPDGDGTSFKGGSDPCEDNEPISNDSKNDAFLQEGMPDRQENKDRDSSPPEVTGARAAAA